MNSYDSILELLKPVLEELDSEKHLNEKLIDELLKNKSTIQELSKDLAINELIEISRRFKFTLDQSLEIFDIVESNEVAKNKLNNILDNHLEDNYDFELLKHYLTTSTPKKYKKFLTMSKPHMIDEVKKLLSKLGLTTEQESRLLKLMRNWTKEQKLAFLKLLKDNPFALFAVKLILADPILRTMSFSSQFLKEVLDLLELLCKKLGLKPEEVYELLKKLLTNPKLVHKLIKLLNSIEEQHTNQNVHPPVLKDKPKPYVDKMYSDLGISDCDDTFTLKTYSSMLNAFDFDEQQKSQLVELLQNNEVALERLERIVENNLESLYSFDELLHHLNKKESKLTLSR